jgi:hypothetical protein
MRDHDSRAARIARVAWLFVALIALAAPWVRAQQPPTTGSSPFWGSNPPQQTNPFASPPPQSTSRAATSVRLPSPVIARVEGRDVTQADFDRIALPYFGQLKAQFGAGFDAAMQRTAALNVLDELIKRELLAIESQRQNLNVAPEEIDKVLGDDPFFLTNGKFDPAKLASFKADPRSNYNAILPRLRETAAMRKVDESLRQRFKPTPAQLRAEWTRRYEQVRFKMFPLMTRDMSLEPEATESEWAAYYHDHADQFARRTRVRLRYLRLALPSEGDSSRAADEKQALARAHSLADSLRRRTLADSAAELTDTGLFELPAAIIPGLGRVAGLTDTLAKADTDSTIRVLGPYVTSDGVFVGAIAERQPRQVPPMREVLGDVKRRADAEHRRVANEADRRAYYESHRERWKGTRASFTRLVLRSTTIPIPPPTPAEVDRWYGLHGHRLFGKSDSSRAWMPPISDSLRAAVRSRMNEDARTSRVSDAMTKLVAGLRGSRDLRALARANGAAAETLTFFPGSAPDSLWRPPFLDSVLTSAITVKGVVQGPRRFGNDWVAWRVDAIDTSFVPSYEAGRARSDIEFNQERSKKEEAEGRAYYDQHRSEFKAPVKYALDYVAINGPSTDSLKISEAELRRRYEANRSSYQQEEQIKARHILFSARNASPEVDRKARARADSLLAAIRKEGGDFEDLAKRFSQEAGAYLTGGDLGWFGRNRMVKEFEDAAFALKPGEISPVVKTLYGYHIIKVEQRRAAGIRPFVEVRSELRAQIAEARSDSAGMRIANSVKRRLALGQRTAAASHGGVVSAEPISTTETIPAI